MAISFEIKNGDVTVSKITGRPNIIGNLIGQDDPDQSRRKTSQDMKRCLSINRIKDGSGAGITEFVGAIDGAGFGSISILLKSRIRSMFTAILRLQRKRLSVRPAAEQFSDIKSLQVVSIPNDRTAYKFRLDTRTMAGRTITQSGTIVSP